MDVALIDPHSANYNFHPDTQLVGLARSHQEFGQYRSVVLWKRPDGRYIQVAGHGYLQAAKSEGATQVRADILPEETPPETVTAILIADNQHAKRSESDDEQLAHLLQEQVDAGFDLTALGSDKEELRQLLETIAEPYFEPASVNEQSQLDHKAKVTCPECGHEFEPE